MGEEFAAANNYGCYGPAMNTHRSAFGGRNFEYYSEDGLLAGTMAANHVNGAATKGVYCYIKHFALNDQETNRESFLLTWASEQAIREIYLKPFELCVKGFQGKAQALMSSYNFIGTKASSENSNLLKNVLRDEWGFVGVVITDYDGSYGYMNSDEAVRSGNDLMLGYGMSESDMFSKSASVHQAMVTAAKNILYTVANSGAYGVTADATADVNEAAAAQVGMSNMDRTFLIVDVTAGILLGLAEIILLVRYFRKKKKSVIVIVEDEKEV